MKANSKTLFTCMALAAGIFISGQAIAQQKPGTKAIKQTEGSGSTTIKTTDMKGEFVREDECVDLYVRKGCVKYSVAAADDSKASYEMVRVCYSNTAEVKPVNVCSRGAKKIRVKYEKEDGNTVIEFTPAAIGPKMDRKTKKPEDAK